jgi:hypothetical protein
VIADRENGRGFPLARFSALLERGSSAAEHLENEHDEREHEQDVDERSDRRQCHDAEQPEDEKDQNNGPQHCPHLLFTAFARKVRAMSDAALARPRPRTLLRVPQLRRMHALGVFVASLLVGLLVIAISIRVEL